MNITETLQGGIAHCNLNMTAAPASSAPWKRRVALYNAMLAQQLGAVEISITRYPDRYVIKTDIPDFVPFEPSLAAAKELMALGDMTLNFSDESGTPVMCLAAPAPDGVRVSGRYTVTGGTDEQAGMSIIVGCLDFYLRTTGVKSSEIAERLVYWNAMVIEQ